MADQEPTELMILFRIVEVLERKMMGGVPDEAESAATGNIANVVNNFIASSPKLVFSTSREGAIMGDNYTTGQAGAVGPHSSAQDMTFNQVWNQLAPDVDLPGLAQELEQVRTEMRRTAEGSLAQDLALAQIAQAEISARSNDGPAMLEHLRQAGAWALDVAKSVGAGVAVAALKSAMGL
jgi:hypothetical protein